MVFFSSPLEVSLDYSRCWLAFVNPSFRELYALESGPMRRFEGAPKATQSSYSPDAVALPAYDNTEFPPFSTAGGQIDDVNAMPVMFEFHGRLTNWYGSRAVPSTLQASDKATGGNCQENKACLTGSTGRGVLCWSRTRSSSTTGLSDRPPPTQLDCKLLVLGELVGTTQPGDGAGSAATTS
jgi:hypothetical protein